VKEKGKTMNTNPTNSVPTDTPHAVTIARDLNHELAAVSLAILDNAAPEEDESGNEIDDEEEGEVIDAEVDEDDDETEH
jgi:hypothetical protein